MIRRATVGFKTSRWESHGWMVSSRQGAAAKWWEYWGLACLE